VADEADVKLTAAEMAAFVRAVGRAQKRRRILLGGYLLALAVMLVGTVAALVVYGRAPRGTFVGWVFLCPFAAVGAILWLFGRWARRT